MRAVKSPVSVVFIQGIHGLWWHLMHLTSKQCLLVEISGKILSHLARNLSCVFLTELDSNQAVQLQRLAKREILTDLRLFCSHTPKSDACATACLSGGIGSLRSIFVWASVYIHRLSLSTAFLYLRSDTAIDPMCVRAANAMVRLHICPGSSELSMFT